MRKIKALRMFCVAVVVFFMAGSSYGFEQIVDNSDSSNFSEVGGWSTSTHYSGYYGANYLRNDDGHGSETATFTFTIPSDGIYKVFARWAAAGNRVDDAQFTVNYGGESSTVDMDQRYNGGQWNEIGTYNFEAGTITVVLSDESDDNGDVIADAVRIIDYTPPSEIRINSGGDEYTDVNGNLWSADYGYNTGNTYSTSSSIDGTTDDVLYRSERWGQSSPQLVYSFSVLNGNYAVNLLFAEISLNGPDRRVFSVMIEGQLVLDNLDIFSEAGYRTALIKSFDPITVTDGQLNIEFSPGIDNPKIAAIEIVRGDPPPTAVDDIAGTMVDTTVSINVIANDTDNDCTIDSSTVAITSQPTNGTSAANTNGTVTYTPSSGYSGTDTFQYTVNNTDGFTSNVAMVSVVVINGGAWSKSGDNISNINSGNVGIGCTNPQTKLAVNGTITATEVKVEAAGGWCDYVFEDGYKLASLAAVEKYVKENKHLPEIPSEKEIQEDGLVMSEMMTLQMKKIEELTLYIIELKKENDTLKDRVVALEGKK